MSQTRRDFVDVLLSRGLLSQEQLEEARTLQKGTGGELEDILVQLRYVSAREVIARALAEAHGVPFLDLTQVTIPQHIIELIPESVARGNIVLPLASGCSGLWVVVSDPRDIDTLQKLQFILNKDIHPVVAVREQIIEAINRHYGAAETESVVSMLAEFTDTAIDFTETDAESEFELHCDLEELASPTLGDIQGFEAVEAPAACLRRPGAPLVSRQATVRYYHRMNPERMFPLLVVLSKKAVQEIVKRGVSQARSERFRVELDSVVEVEPVLPGCACFPPREQVAIREDTVTVTFWVVPHVLGKVMHARVIVRQEGRTLAEVPLEMRVVKQSLALLLGGLSLLLPFLLMLLKHYHLDFESQLEDGFGLYAQVGNWALRSLSPEVLTGVLLLATATAYLWLRPRKRDVFWDVVTAGAEQPTEGNGQVHIPRPPSEDDDRANSRPDVGRHQARLFASAERCYRIRDHAQALAFYDGGLALGPARPLLYHHASLAAFHSGNTDRALAILQHAAAHLPFSEMRGAMWYNMGCFATRLGRFEDAMHYLNRAIDRGYTHAAKYRHDPDLEPLRWRRDFKGLLAELRQRTRG